MCCMHKYFYASTFALCCLGSLFMGCLSGRCHRAKGNPSDLSSSWIYMGTPTFLLGWTLMHSQILLQIFIQILRQIVIYKYCCKYWYKYLYIYPYKCRYKYRYGNSPPLLLGLTLMYSQRLIKYWYKYWYNCSYKCRYKYKYGHRHFSPWTDSDAFTAHFGQRR